MRAIRKPWALLTSFLHSSLNAKHTAVLKTFLPFFSGPGFLGSGGFAHGRATPPLGVGWATEGPRYKLDGGFLPDEVPSKNTERRSFLIMWTISPWVLLRCIRKLQKATISFIVSVCLFGLSFYLSVQMEQLCSHLKDFHKTL